ncbi:hypothetical protein MXB_1609, partial [Myxobolus squamalis]
SYILFEKISPENIFSSFVAKTSSCSFFEHIYPLISHNRHHRLKFIDRIYNYLSSEDCELNFLVFCSLSLAYLPFKSYNDIIHLIQQIEITIGLFDDAATENQLTHDSFDAINVLLRRLLGTRLKHFLMKAYNINHRFILLSL